MTMTPGEDDGAARHEDDRAAFTSPPPTATPPTANPPTTPRSELSSGPLGPQEFDHPSSDAAGAGSQDSRESDSETEPPGGPNPFSPQRSPGWRSSTSDADVDAAFAAIVSGIVATPDLPAAAERHPSAVQRPPDTSDDRARRRELRRLERAAEVAAFAAHEAEIQAEREADEAHFEPPEPPPLPRPKGRTIGALLMLLGGIVLLVRPGLLAVGFDLTMVISVILILGGAAILLTGIWKRRSADADGWDDGAVV